MWNPTARALHSRAGLRYGSDLTDAEWAIVAPLRPSPAIAGDVAAGSFIMLVRFMQPAHARQANDHARRPGI